MPIAASQMPMSEVQLQSIVSMHHAGYRSTVKTMSLNVPTEAVLISGRRLDTMTDEDVLRLVRGHSVVIHR